MTADIVEVDKEAEQGTRSRQDHGVTRTWTDLQRFGGRRLSLVLNDDGDSHRVYVHGSTDGPADWSLNPNVQTQLVQPLRDALTDHIENSTAPEGALRALASAGSELALRLDERLGRDKDAKSLFRGLRTEADQVVQIVRADAHQAIPWGLLYDWDVPAAVDSATVCWGVTGSSPCTHANGDGVVCVRGFWGIRHRIEELVGAVYEPALVISIPNAALRIDLARGLPNNSYIDTFVSTLQRSATVHEIAGTDSLLERLWDQARSPVCAVVGHLNAAGEIECGTSETGITASTITTHARTHRDLDDPHPLVLLFVCESGAVTPELVASQALALTSAGIAGLVCTETVVRSSHIRDFGTALITELLDTIGVSGAIEPFPFAGSLQRARTSLLADQLVVGLAFLAFGPATLTFEVSS